MSNSSNTPLPFDQLAKAIEARRSVYGYISGLRLDRAAPGEAWSSLPYRPIFVGDAKTGVLHGGVVTAMLDETCGMAVQLALDGTRSTATLDLRIDYQKPATPGLDIKAHSFCYRVTRSIAFVRATAFQESEDDPVATATACFMIGANRTNMLIDERTTTACHLYSKRRRILRASSPIALLRVFWVFALATMISSSCPFRPRSSGTLFFQPFTAA